MSIIHAKILVSLTEVPSGSRSPDGDSVGGAPHTQKLKHLFVTETLNFDAHAHLIATISATVTGYSATLLI